MGTLRVAVLAGVGYVSGATGLSWSELMGGARTLARAFSEAFRASVPDLLVLHLHALVGVEAAGGVVAYGPGGPLLVERPPRVPSRPLDPWADGRLPLLLEAASLVRASADAPREVGVSLTGPVSLAAGVAGEVAFLRSLGEGHVPWETLHWAQESVATEIRAARAEGLAVMVAEPLMGLVSLPVARTLAPVLAPTLALGVQVLHICGPSLHLLPLLGRFLVPFLSLEGPALWEVCARDEGPRPMGGIDPLLVRRGPPSELWAEVGEVVERLGPRGVVAPSCELVPQTPVAHVRALVEAAREAWRTYDQEGM